MTALAPLGIALAILLVFDLMALQWGPESRPDFSDELVARRLPNWF